MRYWISLSVLGVAVLGASTFQLKLKINGKTVAGSTVTIDGKAYVPVSALKAAGATTSVSNGVFSIDFPSGGAMQQAGLEGKIGEWLFNGIWRFRVDSISKEGGSYRVDVTIKNGTTFNGYSPGGTGWQGISLVLSDGTIIQSRSDSPELRDTGLNQAAANQASVFFETDSASEPDRIILRFDPKGIEGTPLKFSVADPTFRVNLKKKS